MSKRINWKVFEKMKPGLIQQFKDWGIISCEIRFQGCKGQLYTGFAHSKRRCDIYTIEDMREVILACSFCHSIIDGKYPDPDKLPEKYFWSNEETLVYVRQKIEERIIW